MTVRSPQLHGEVTRMMACCSTKMNAILLGHRCTRLPDTGASRILTNMNLARARVDMGRERVKSEISKASKSSCCIYSFLFLHSSREGARKTKIDAGKPLCQQLCHIASVQPKEPNITTLAETTSDLRIDPPTKRASFATWAVDLLGRRKNDT